MACIETRPQCGAPTRAPVPTPLTETIATIGAIISIVSVAVVIGKAIAEGTILTWIAAIGGAAAGGAIAGAVTAITLIVVIGIHVLDRCVQGQGLPECIAGVVNGVVESFSSAWDELFPFTAMHDRVDIVAKSQYWPVIEDGEAFVFCTDEAPPRRSEIMRCYFFDRRVCEAGHGAQVGAAVGGVAGVIAAAAVAAAIGCATVILCLVALLVAALIAAAAVLIGALAGGQIAKAAAEDDSPTSATGEPIGVGHLLTVFGNMQTREYDENANVLYWVSSANFHGASSSPQPFSYCEIDEELAMDSCPLPPII